MKEIDFDAYKRFEDMARIYLNGNEAVRKTILSFLSEKEKKVFLNGVGFYHLYTDQRFYDAVKSALGKQIYNELHAVK